jgi:hypothetical protein
MKTFKPNDKRSRTTILLSWILIALTVISLVSSVLQYRLLDSLANGAPVDDVAIAANDLREGIIGIIASLCNITWTVAFLMWLYRAYANLQTKVSYQLSRTPGWVVGDFYIPITCLYRPYQAMKELYDDTQDLLADGEQSKKTTLQTAYVGWWWAMWILSALAAGIVLRMSFSGSETLDDFISLTRANIVSTVLDILSTIMTLVVVRQYSRVEPLLETLPDASEVEEKPHD